MYGPDGRQDIRCDRVIICWDRLTFDCLTSTCSLSLLRRPVNFLGLLEPFDSESGADRLADVRRDTRTTLTCTIVLEASIVYRTDHNQKFSYRRDSVRRSPKTIHCQNLDSSLTVWVYLK